MSMTREEAIKALRLGGGLEIRGDVVRLAEFMQGLDVALSALRPVSREQVERMRSRWITVVEVNGEQYSKCAACQMGLDGLEDAYLFCPHCGARMDKEDNYVRND